jgi:hypothetical protein
MVSMRETLLRRVLGGGLLPPQDYVGLLEMANAALENEPPEVRPRDGSGLPGGLVLLNPELETLLVPDLHGRTDFLLTVLLSEEWDALARMQQGRLQVVCVGDGFHGEARAYQRWLAAYSEWQTAWQHHAAMDEEMAESLGVMEIVMRVKLAVPESFHFLKGNHENIANEAGGGNYPFVKFVEEGEMVASYVRHFLGADFLQGYYRFEKNLPLLAVGGGFLVSHAEPARAFAREEIVEYRGREDVVAGLTWTDNDHARGGSVSEMLTALLGAEAAAGAFYFGGHRPVRGLYHTRAGGRYVQFHNPARQVVVRIEPGRPIDLARDVVQADGAIPELAGR